MLKKAGMILAVSTASLLAVSPMAFAGDYVGGQGHDGVKGDKVKGDDVKGHGHDDQHDDHDGHHGGHGYHGNQNSEGTLNGANGNNVSVPIQVCNNDVQGQVGAVPVQDVGESPTGVANGAAGLLFGHADAQQESHVDKGRSCGQGSAGAGYGNADD